MKHWLLEYPREWLRPDVIAGLTAAAVVIPKAMAYATIAGLPVQVGLYTAFVPLLVYALLGTSRPLSTSTSGTLAILAAAQLASVQGPEATEVMATLTAQVGIALLIAWGLRLGFVANFISDPVLTGFKAGIGLVIVVDQVPKLLGVHFDKGTFLENCASIVRHLPDTSPRRSRPDGRSRPPTSRPPSRTASSWRRAWRTSRARSSDRCRRAAARARPR